MTILEILIVALGVSVDAFAVSLAIDLALPEVTTASIRKTVASLAIPALVLSAVSQWVGHVFLSEVAAVKDWVSPVVLTWIGSVMIAGSNSRENRSIFALATSSTKSLILLGLAANADVAATGMVIGVRADTTWPAVLTIPTATAVMSLIGLRLGSRLHERAGRYAEIAGGSLLFGYAEYCFLF